MNDPLVSVIIPTYNRSRLLRETVDSVLAQTYPNIECVVVDDGSTDDTPAVMAAYAGRIVYIRTENQGGTKARNTGIAAARGKFLNFLDHDDLLLPEKIARQMEILRSRPKIGLVHCGYYRMDKDGRYLDIVNHLPEGDVRTEIVQGCFMWSGAPLVRRQVIEEVGVFDPSVYSSDQDLWLRIALAGYEFGCAQEPLGAYRILPGSSMEEVSLTERLDMPIIDRIFADPRLPLAAQRMKTQAYFNQRFWLACRYYVTGQWDNAIRNIEEALKLRPELKNRSLELLYHFASNAFDPRVPDPVQFAENVFAHLPAALEAVMRPHYPDMISWMHVGVSMRLYATGQIAEAQQHFNEALGCDPSLANRPAEFRRTLVDYALRLPGKPNQYIDTVLSNLPPKAAALARQHRQLRSEAHLACAFQDYHAGKRRAVPSRVLAAIFYRPVLLKNKGVWAILVKSLPALLNKSA